MNRVRLIGGDDLSSILVIQRACYSPALNESEAVIRQRLASAPDTCWIAESDSMPIGYLFSYGSTVGRVTPLGGSFTVAASPDCLYLHDIAIIPAVRGSGAATALLEAARSWAAARRIADVALVSVGDTRTYWSRRGFVAASAVTPAQSRALSSYGVDACYMTQRWKAVQA